jgi:signal transduction histidine kinase
LSVGVAVTSEPFVAAYLYRRWRRDGKLLDHPRNVSALLLVAGPVSCACAATLAGLTLVASGSIDWQRFPETWTTWVIGDLAGIYLLAPAILAWGEGDSVRLRDRDREIVPISITGLAIACLIAFLDGFQMETNLRLAFLPFPLVVYISYRFNDRLASASGAFVAAAAILATANGHGPFGDEPRNLALIQLQVFTFVGILTALFTRAIVNERNAAEGESRRLSADLAHLSRVTLMGELAAGMAHEYHQPLTAISNYASASLMILRKHDDAYREVLEPLRSISDEAIRAANIIDRLKEFLQKRQPRRTPCDVNEIAAGAVSLVQMAHPCPDVSVSLRLAPDLPPARVDSVQVTQILTNLLVNACESLAANGIAHRHVQVSTQLQNHGSVRIVVEDNGPGMSAAVARSCFDQFYSTKDGGLGIGLGISRTLAQAHGGSLRLEESTAGRTRFSLELPLRADDDE